MEGIYYTRAKAKLNLMLSIRGVRDDGYHDIISIFDQVDLFDELWVVLSGDSISVEIMSKDIAITEAENLVAKAIGAFFGKFAKTIGVSVKLLKKIPIGSGLGGGSSDAAAILRILYEILRKPFSSDELLEVASSIGGDVPFFLVPGCREIGGKGNVLGKEVDFSEGAYLIIVPSCMISTSEAYALYDHALAHDASIEKITRSHYDGKTLFNNDFEAIIFPRYNDINICKKYLMNAGAVNTAMTGSGAAVFGLFPSYPEAIEAFKKINKLNFKELQSPPRNLFLVTSSRRSFPVVRLG